MLDPDPARDPALPSDDYVRQARLADLALARQITMECRRPVPAYDGHDEGPTEAWRLFLAFTDPALLPDEDDVTPWPGVAA